MDNNKATMQEINSKAVILFLILLVLAGLAYTDKLSTEVITVLSLIVASLSKGILDKDGDK